MSFHLFILILHVLGAGVLIGIVVLSVFAVVKPPVTAKAIDRLEFVGRFGMVFSIWQFITGVVLAAQEWDEFQASRLFWTKMAVYVIEGTLASQLLQRQAKRARMATAGGQPMAATGLRTTLWLHAGLVMAIAVIGVILVSGGEE